MAVRLSFPLAGAGFRLRKIRRPSGGFIRGRARDFELFMNLDFNLAPESQFFNFEEEPSLLQVSSSAFEAARARGASISEDSTRACAWDFAHMDDYSL